MMRSSWVLGLMLVMAGCGQGIGTAKEVCTIPEGVPPVAGISVEVSFGPSTCATPDAKCSVRITGSTMTLTTSATICPPNDKSAGVDVKATCEIPPAKVGTYTLAPFGKTLEIREGATGTSCHLP